jgi:hypothetical protein
MPIRPFLAGQDLTERASPKCHSRMHLVTFIRCNSGRLEFVWKRRALP